MGCHTWYYKDFDHLTPEEYQEVVVNELANHRLLKNYLNHGEQAIIDHINELYGEDREYFNELYGSSEEHAIAELTQYIHLRAKNLRILQSKQLSAKEFLRLGLHKNYKFLTKKHKGKLYINLGYGDDFRVCGYPTKMFTSYSSLMRWLYKHKAINRFHYYDGDTQKYIHEITPQIRNTIKGLFRKYENHLLIRFG